MLIGPTTNSIAKEKSCKQGRKGKGEMHLLHFYPTKVKFCVRHEQQLKFSLVFIASTS